MTVDKSKIQNSPFETTSNFATPNLRQTFNNTQNWTVPDGVYGIWVHLAGGGAGGNSRSTGTTTPNGTGGAGGNGVFGYTPVTPGSTVGITIGAGGNGGTIGANVSANTYGNEGGKTVVNTSGTCWAAGGGWRPRAVNTTNRNLGETYTGKLYGVTRQQIVFGPRTNSPRSAYLFAGGNEPITGIDFREGVSFGGTNDQNNYDQSTDSNAQRSGLRSLYGGGAGGCAVTNSVGGGNGGNGGNQVLTGYTGGTGATFAATNAGAGGGGAGIVGNGANTNGTTGGAGGAGGGGGGGGGANAANTGCSGGAGGAGAVVIYY